MHGFIKRLISPKNATFYIFIIYLLLPILGFWRNFAPYGINSRFFGADFTGYYYPDFVQGVEIVKNLIHLKSPIDALWDPYNFMGFPLAGIVDRAGVFYPIRFLFYFIASVLPSNYTVFIAMYYSLFHLSLAGIFTYIFCRHCLKFSHASSLIAGIIYSLGGSMVYVGVFTNVVTGPAFLPLQLTLLFKALEKKSFKLAIIAGFSIAPILLSGYTSTFLYNNLFVFIFLLFFFVKNFNSLLRLLSITVISNIVGILLSTVVLLPSMEIRELATRQILNVEGSGTHPFTIDGISHYFAPYLFGTNDVPTAYGYIGFLALILVFWAVTRSKDKVTRILSLMSILLFALSMTRETVLHDLFYRFVPFYGYFRFHVFIQYLVSLSLSILAARGITILEKKMLEYSSITFLLKRILTFLFAFMIFLFLFKSFYPVFGALSDNMIRAIIINLFVILGTLWTFNFLYKNSNFWFKFCLVLIITLDLFTFIMKNPINNSDYDPRTVIMKTEPLGKFEGEMNSNLSRAYLVDSALRYNSGPLKIFQFEGIHSLISKYYSELLRKYSENTSLTSPLLDITGVQYIFTTKMLEKVDTPGINLVFKTVVHPNEYGAYITRSGEKIQPGTNVYVYENSDFLRRAYLVKDWQLATSNKEILDKMDKVNLKETAIIIASEEIPKPVSQGNWSSEVKILGYRNSYIKTGTSSNQKSLLVLGDLFFPGWKAYIDGKEAKIYRTNMAMRGVFVDQGEHTVEFKYIPVKFFLGLAISIISFILFTIICLSSYFKRREFSKPITKTA